VRAWTLSASFRPKISLCAILVCTLGTAAPAAEPGSNPARLDGVLVRDLDRKIQTERGAIRIIRLGHSQGRRDAIFFIHGDPDWHRIGSFSQSIRDDERKALTNHLEWLRNFGQRAKVTVYFVARTGMFGSEGETSEFRHEDSYMAVSRAINAVVEQDSLTGEAIVGHSGGAAVALYHAIRMPTASARCYVLASGVYNLGAMAAFSDLQKTKGVDPSRVAKEQLPPVAFAPLPPVMATKLKYFEPLFHVATIEKDPRRSFFAVTDRRDTIAPYFASENLIERLTALGHQARLVETATRAPTHHFTYDAAMDTAATCLKGAPKVP